jgi:hypothetical protein
MVYRNKVSVAFDVYHDMRAYGFMKVWRTLAAVDFNFHNADDIDELTSTAQDADYITKVLRKRLENSFFCS